MEECVICFELTANPKLTCCNTFLCKNCEIKIVKCPCCRKFLPEDKNDSKIFSTISFPPDINYIIYKRRDGKIVYEFQSLPKRYDTGFISYLIWQAGGEMVVKKFI
jgi:hypothetical protein